MECSKYRGISLSVVGKICGDLVDRARKVTEGFTDDEQDQIYTLNQISKKA